MTGKGINGHTQQLGICPPQYRHTQGYLKNHSATLNHFHQDFMSTQLKIPSDTIRNITFHGDQCLGTRSDKD